ncbi:hypothetical protein CDAR_381951 [Caerostris darwini]|uniref:Uncharacterized protein n=1 Tax=Caerostris darwini TaxID=1538125 RepID=A0AAV4V5J8_9ARAC|nr:hypothetical protein CDAR_381951 [Caerostris darwini]
MLPALRLGKLNYAFSALETSTSGAISQRREASLQLNSAVLFQVPIRELIRSVFFHVAGKEVFATILDVSKFCFIPVAVWGNEYTKEYNINLTDPFKNDRFLCFTLAAQIFLLLRYSGAKLTAKEIGDPNWKK